MSTKNEKQTIVISATSSIGRALFKKMAEKKTQKCADTLTFTYCQKKQNKA